MGIPIASQLISNPGGQISQGFISIKTCHKDDAIFLFKFVLEKRFDASKIYSVQIAFIKLADSKPWEEPTSLSDAAFGNPCQEGW